MDIGEFELIGRIAAVSAAPEGMTGIGDDCAILPQRDGMDTLVSTDMLVEGTHFLLGDAAPSDLGWKSAVVNISDIAAMGGRPAGTFLSIAVPPGVDSAWVDKFMAGYSAACSKYGAPLLGGDTVGSPDRLCINVTVLGQCPSGTAVLRSGARPGDLVCVTGCLGDSAGGLEVILRGLDRSGPAGVLVERHYLPRPRVDEGVALAACPGVHAMMDISDGVDSDLRHILEASGVGARLDAALLPVSEELRRFCAREGLDAAFLAARGGEDYELLFTMDPDARPEIPYTVIGHIVEHPGLVWNGLVGRPEGFRHF